MKTRKKILIVDDNKSIHKVLLSAFSVEEFDIVHAYDGEEALRMAEEELPDLILLDIVMPIMDGRDVCKHLRNNLETQDMKIIMMTSKGEQHDRILGLALGADDYIPKPFSPSYLYRQAKKLLNE